LLQFKKPYDVTKPCFLSNVKVDSDVVIENIFPPDEFSNIIISVENIELHLNKDILRMHSPVFKAMLGHNFEEGRSGRIKLPGKKANNWILFLSYFYPDKTYRLKDKVDYFDLLQLCDEYQVDWVKEKINDHMVQRLKVFFNSSGHFDCETQSGIEGFDYRYHSCSEADYTRSYDDTLVLYFTYLAEQFNLNVVLLWCHKYLFELELYYLENMMIFKLLSKQSKYVIYRYCIRRGLESKGRNENQICELALRECVINLTNVEFESETLTPSKRKTSKRHLIVK